MLQKALSDLRNALLLYRVWIFQAYHDISAKYKRTVLGSLWIAASLVTTSLGVAIVFGGIFGQSIAQALPFTMGGILCFTMVSFVLVDAAEIFVSSAGIIKNHAYPFSYYVLEGTARSFLTFLHNLVVFYITVIVLGQIHIPDWTLLPGLLLDLTAMITWGTIIGMMASRFRDLRYLMPYLSQILFFMTPIFWHADQLKGLRLILVDYNPLYGLVEIIRSPLLGQAAPALCWQSAAITAGSGVVIWLISFSAYRRRIPFWV